MPKYVYACSDEYCAKHIQVTHGIHEEGPTICEKCGQETLVKIPAEINYLPPPEDDLTMKRKKNAKVGELTADYIEVVKKESEELRNELKKNLFELLKKGNE